LLHFNGKKLSSFMRSQTIIKGKNTALKDSISSIMQVNSKLIQGALLITLLLVSLQCMAFPVDSRVPGGVAIIELESESGTPHFKFREKPLLISRVDNRTVAIVGLSLGLKPGEYFISGHYGDTKQLVKKFFSVKEKQYTTQHITIKDKRKVNPVKQDMERIIPEQKRI
jgi:hypothetical protein